VPDDLLDTLATRFRFGPGNVRAAVATAVATAAVRSGAGAAGAGDVATAARHLTGHRLDSLARRVEPACGWDDLVLPAPALTQLHELCQRVELGPRVWQDWGLERTTSRARGTTALFTGPPGTGKTMAGEVVAGELGLDMYAIDLSTVVSKYIGDTEKNLERIFATASDADVVLLFDEADALFGKRSEVHDAHDRYANVETAYLLQRMESFDGIAILATNLRANLDDAFTRRLQFIVDFPVPAEPERRRIWGIALPEELPLQDDVDLDRLARDVRFTGGNIRNAVLHAAFLAAAQDTAIGMRHLDEAVRRESLKMGRVVPSVAAAGADPGRE
jgi:SpoVK/Ycf46/Vps4 family AAA+-type ATPase